MFFVKGSNRHSSYLNFSMCHSNNLPSVSFVFRALVKGMQRRVSCILCTVFPKLPSICANNVFQVLSKKRLFHVSNEELAPLHTCSNSTPPHGTLTRFCLWHCFYLCSSKEEFFKSQPSQFVLLSRSSSFTNSAVFHQILV